MRVSSGEKIETIWTLENHKMFQPVEVKDLKVNQKYKIKGDFLEYMGRFKGTVQFYYPEGCGLRFDKVYNITIRKNSDMTLFDDTSEFYAFVSENPQEKMERRAVNLIVQRLLGDACFKW